MTKPAWIGLLTTTALIALLAGVLIGKSSAAPVDTTPTVEPAAPAVEVPISPEPPVATSIRISGVDEREDMDEWPVVIVPLPAIPIPAGEGRFTQESEDFTLIGGLECTATTQRDTNVLGRWNANVWCEQEGVYKGGLTMSFKHAGISSIGMFRTATGRFQLEVETL